MKHSLNAPPPAGHLLVHLVHLVHLVGFQDRSVLFVSSALPAHQSPGFHHLLLVQRRGSSQQVLVPVKLTHTWTSVPKPSSWWSSTRTPELPLMESTGASRVDVRTRLGLLRCRAKGHRLTSILQGTLIQPLLDQQSCVVGLWSALSCHTQTYTISPSSICELLWESNPGDHPPEPAPLPVWILAGSIWIILFIATNRSRALKV